MALNQLPAIEATIQVVHSGVTDGVSFTTTLDGSDGAPMAPTRIFTFDLNDFAPDLVAMDGGAPLVGAYREPSGERVEVDVTVEPERIVLTFWALVEPSEYRIKVVA